MLRSAAACRDEVIPMIDPLYSLSGFAVGLLVGMTGVGGGALMTPILIMLFGVHPATAVGTDLLYAAATKTGGSLVHGLARSIDWRVVGRLATGSIPATVLTLAVLSLFNLSGDAASNLITLVLSVALFATAFVLVFGASIVAALSRARHRPRPAQDSREHNRGGGRAWLPCVDFIGRRRSVGGYRALDALSANADGQGRRLGHRACRSFDSRRRARSLDDGFGQLGDYRLAARGLAAGYFCRQLFRDPYSRARASAGAGDDAFHGCDTYCLRSRNRSFVDFHGVLGAGGALNAPPSDPLDRRRASRPEPKPKLQ